MVELPRLDLPQGQMPLHQLLDADRVVELRPFRPQRRQRVVLAPDVLANSRDLLGLRVDSNLIL